MHLYIFMINKGCNYVLALHGDPVTVIICINYFAFHIVRIYNARGNGLSILLWWYYACGMYRRMTVVVLYARDIHVLSCVWSYYARVTR